MRSQVDVPADAGAGNGPTGHASLAEGFILRNIAHFIGTFWQVGDEAAHRFAITFYSELLTGAPVSLAVLTARQALEKNGEIDWVSYLHFGEPGETLGRSW